ncbi:pentapeptide repeat-containing protein [Micromonospora sp. NPDC005652]|uniref:NACHT domain-containing protein n=1 Tax=Micromonospora sp. NPDC005652 TaxID=3157046 RepID=UPI003404A918
MPLLNLLRPVFTMLGGVALKRAMRDRRVIRALKKVRALPRPETDPGAVYARAVVTFAEGRSNSVELLLGDRFVQEAFLAGFESGDWKGWRVELVNTAERGRETGEFGRLSNLDVRAIDDGFIEAFLKTIAAGRTPHEIELVQKVDAVSEQVRAVREAEEARRQRIEPARGAQTQLDRLSDDVRAWLVAKRFGIVFELAEEAQSRGWIIRTPAANGRRSHVAVLAVDGELQARHVQRALRILSDGRADTAWTVAAQRISSAAQGAARDTGVACLTLAGLVDMSADFTPYLDWLEAEAARLRLDTTYVPLSGIREELDLDGVRQADSEYGWRDGGLDAFVQRWLDDPDADHLSVLGEFGVGKSWFSLHLAWRMGRAWSAARTAGHPERPRLPLLVPLRDYANVSDVEAVAAKFFADHDIPITTEMFRYLNRTGRLLLILEGFDEMAARVDRHTMAFNFEQLTKIAVPGSKVLLTSRTEYFPDAERVRTLFSGQGPVPGESETRFEVIEIAPLDDEQIVRMLRGRTDDEALVQRLTRNFHLLDLLRRPVMSDLVMTAIPSISVDQPIDIAQVYLHAVRTKMDNDIGMVRTFTGRVDKVFFLCELSWQMLSESLMTLNYREFPDKLRAFLGPAASKARDIDHWEQDMRSQTLLVRNDAGDYRPAHRSLVEFFVTYKFAAELGLLGGPFLDLIGGVAEAPDATWSQHMRSERVDGRLKPLGQVRPEPMSTLADTFGALALDHTMLTFLGPMLAAAAVTDEQVLAIAHATRDVPAGLVGANCVKLLSQYDGIDLSDMALPGSKFARPYGLRADQTRTTMRNADMRRADLRDSDVITVDLTGADLSGAQLAGASTLISDRRVQTLAVTPAGAIVAEMAHEFGVWAGGDLAGEFRTLATTSGLRLEKSMSLLVLDDRRVYSYTAGPAVIDIVTGERSKVRSLRWAVPLDWQGESAVLTDSSEAGRLDVLARATLAKIGTCEDPRPSRRSEWRWTFKEAPGVGLSHTRYSGSKIQVTGLDQVTGRWPPVADMDLGQGKVRPIGGGYLLHVSPDSGPTMLGLDGQLLAGPDDIKGTPWTSLSGGIRYYPAHRVLLRTDGPQMTAWPLTGRSAAWSLSVPGLNPHTEAHPDGETFLYTAETGEVGRRRIDTGAVVSRTSLHNGLRGARFSRSCGLDPELLEAMALAGAILVN